MMCWKEVSRTDSKRYIMVDEYQDTNTSQYTLIRMLRSDKYEKPLRGWGRRPRAYTMWRGANIGNILDFEKDFPNAVIKSWNKTTAPHRIYTECGQCRYPVTISTENQKNYGPDTWGGCLSKFYQSATDLDGSAFSSRHDYTQKKKYRPLLNFAILYRTNAQSRVLESSFVKKCSLPYFLEVRDSMKRQNQRCAESLKKL